MTTADDRTTEQSYSTDDLAVRAARTRRGLPYLAVTDGEGAEVAAVFATVDGTTGAVTIAFEQYADCEARFEIVEHTGVISNKIVWCSGISL